MNPITAVWPGRPFPRGAIWDGEGVNFALFSEHAGKVDLCIFDDEGCVLQVQWAMGNGSRLHLIANFAASASGLVTFPPGEILYATAPLATGAGGQAALPAWTVAYALEAA